MYEDPQSFAESIYKLLVDFMSSGSVASLEDYWLVNINAIKTMRKIDESLYLKLIEKFKEQKNEINANDNGSGKILNNRGSKQSRQDDERELERRKRKTAEYRKHHSTAGLR
jgi:hypothetical protein|tara:strand:+ start:530 stop:865 length:336 start_codon:yes stop_codon:yes gene_type:complete